MRGWPGPFVPRPTPAADASAGQTLILGSKHDIHVSPHYTTLLPKTSIHFSKVNNSLHRHTVHSSLWQYASLSPDRTKCILTEVQSASPLPTSELEQIAQQVRRPADAGMKAHELTR
jgi:hypothetical protein